MLILHLLFPFLNQDGHVDGRLEPQDKDSSHSESNHPILPTCEFADVESPGIAEKQEDLGRELVEREVFYRSQLIDRGGGKALEVERCTSSVIRDGPHLSRNVALVQPEPAEKHVDLFLAHERLAKKEAEESCEEKEVKALKMDVEGEAEEENVRQRALQVETVVSGTDVEQQPLHQDAPVEKSQVCQNLLFFWPV